MKNLFRCLTLSVLCLSTATVQADGLFGGTFDDFSTNLKVGGYVGFREDSFGFSLKRNPESSTISTDVCFDEVKIIQKGISADLQLFDTVNLRLWGDYGGVYNIGRGGDSWDIYVALGYPVPLSACGCDWPIGLVPIVGYGYSEVFFRTCTNDFENLEHELRTNWYGPFIGLELSWDICCNWKLYSSGAYQWTHLKSKGKSTRTISETSWDRDRFHINSNEGHGFYYASGIQYQVCDNGFLELGAWYQQNVSDHGHQKGRHTSHDDSISKSAHPVVVAKAAVESTGSVPNVSVPKVGDSVSSDPINIRNRLRRAEWRSAVIQFGGTYRF